MGAEQGSGARAVAALAVGWEGLAAAAKWVAKGGSSQYCRGLPVRARPWPLRAEGLVLLER